MSALYYKKRINAAFDYISDHLQEDITIARLAKESGFSSFHFQRLFKSQTGESPYESVLRLRLEKSLFFIKYRPTYSLTQISTECGFGSYENFSRQFKVRFKVSPRTFRNCESIQNSRIYHEELEDDYYPRIEESRTLPMEEKTVTIEERKSMPIVKVKATFGEDGSELIDGYRRLIAWAEKHEVHYQGENRRFGMSIDNIEATPARRYRYDFALACSIDHPLEDLIERDQIPAGKYATVHCVGNLNDVAQTWDFLYKSWLPNSGYQPVHHPAIEEFIKGPEEIGWTSFDLKCRILIEPILKS